MKKLVLALSWTEQAARAWLANSLPPMAIHLEQLEREMHLFDTHGIRKLVFRIQDTGTKHEQMPGIVVAPIGLRADELKAVPAGHRSRHFMNAIRTAFLDVANE